MDLRFPTSIEGIIPHHQLGVVSAPTPNRSPAKKKSLLTTPYNSTQLKQRRIFNPTFVPAELAPIQGRFSPAIDTLTAHSRSSLPQSSGADHQSTTPSEHPTTGTEQTRIDNDASSSTYPTDGLSIEELIALSRQRMGLLVSSPTPRVEWSDEPHESKLSAANGVRSKMSRGRCPQKLDPLSTSKLQGTESRGHHRTLTHSSQLSEAKVAASPSSPLPTDQEDGGTPASNSLHQEVSGASSPSTRGRSHSGVGSQFQASQMKDLQAQLALSQRKVAALEEHQLKLTDQLVAAKRELERKDDAIEDRNKELESAVNVKIALLGRIERLEKRIYELELQATEPEKRNRELLRMNVDLQDKAAHFKAALDDTDSMLRNARARVGRLEEEAQLRRQDALETVSRAEVVAWKSREVELLDANSRLQALLSRTQGQLDAAVLRIQKSREVRRGGEGSTTPRPQWGLLGAAFPDAASTVQRVRLAYDVINGYTAEVESLRLQVQKYKQLFVPPSAPTFSTSPGVFDGNQLRGAALTSFSKEGMSRAQRMGSEWLMTNRYLPKLGSSPLIPLFLRGDGRANNHFLSESDVVGLCKLAWVELDVSRPPVPFDEAVQRMVKKYAPHSSTNKYNEPRGKAASHIASQSDFAYSFWYGLHWYGSNPTVALTRDLVYGSVQDTIVYDLIFDVRKVKNALITAAKKLASENGQQLRSPKSDSLPMSARTSPGITPLASIKGSELVDQILRSPGNDASLLAFEAASNLQSLYLPIPDAIRVVEEQFPLKPPNDVKQLIAAIHDIASGKRRPRSGDGGESEGDDNDKMMGGITVDRSQVSVKTTTSTLQGHNPFGERGVSLRSLFTFNSTRREHSIFVELLHSQYLTNRATLLHMYVECLNTASQQTAAEATAKIAAQRRVSNSGETTGNQALEMGSDGDEEDEQGRNMNGQEAVKPAGIKTNAGTLLPLPSTLELASGGFVTPHALSHQLWKRDSGIPAQHMDELLAYLFNINVRALQVGTEEFIGVDGGDQPPASGGGLQRHQGLPGDNLVRTYGCRDVCAEYGSLLGRLFSRPLYRFTPISQYK